MPPMSTTATTARYGFTHRGVARGVSSEVTPPHRSRVEDVGRWAAVLGAGESRGAHIRFSTMRVALCIGIGIACLALASVSSSKPEAIERGYATPKYGAAHSRFTYTYRS